jgi:hypothetical protein
MLELQMARQIDVSQQTYAELEELAEPFIDKTPEDVIRKLLHAYKGTKPPSTAPPGKPREFGGMTPNLGHTKLLTARLNGVSMDQPNWNRFLDHVISEAAKKLKSPKALKDLIVINCIEGKKEEHGYHFLPAAGLSVQGQDSNGAWKGIAHLAKAMKFHVDVVFIWLDTPKAANPNQTGRLEVVP